MQSRENIVESQLGNNAMASLPIVIGMRSK